ncbi:MAG: anthranilate synthase component I [Phycisphaerae bacterium]|nr:anthranilate synthase component I [Phycisphaerae bacterium]
MRHPFDIAADLDTPVSAYRKLGAIRPCFLLESVEGGSRLARYSFLGLDPAFTLRIDNATKLVTRSGEEIGEARDIDAFLRHLRTARDDAPTLLPDVSDLPFNGGIVGAMGYDAVRFFEPTGLRANESDGALALYVAPRSMLVFDHLTRRVALLHAGEEWERQSLRREIIHALRGPHPPEPVRAGHAPPEPSIDRDAFLDAVGRAKRHITEGDVFQLVLAIRYSGASRSDPFQVYRALRLLNPSSYMYFLDIEGTQVVGSSPEALFRFTAEGEASLRPIAGTRPRGATEAEDDRHAAELVADPKEIAEHVMLVDLARHDLGRLAEPGTTRVEPYRVVERYSHVMHLVSGVTSKMREGVDAFDVLAASFPAGTLVGAPKVRAMQLIDEIEPTPRGFYAGAVGYFGKPHASGDAPPTAAPSDQAICIRTITFDDGTYTYQAGAGLVADSVPETEHDEVRNKVGAIEAALKLVDEGL